MKNIMKFTAEEIAKMTMDIDTKIVVFGKLTSVWSPSTPVCKIFSEFREIIKTGVGVAYFIFDKKKELQANFNVVEDQLGMDVTIRAFKPEAQAEDMERFKLHAEANSLTDADLALTFPLGEQFCQMVSC